MLETLLKRDRSIILAGLIVIIILAWVYLFYLAQDMTSMEMPATTESGMAQNIDAAPQSSDSSGSMNNSMNNMEMPKQNNGMSDNMDMSKGEKMDMSKPASTAMTSGESAAAGAGMGMAIAMVVPQSQAWNLPEFILMFVMWTTMMVAMMVPSAAPMILLFAATNRQQAVAFNPFGRTSLFVLGYLLVWAAFSFIATSTQGILHSAALLSPVMATTNTILAALLLLVAGLFQWTPYKYACLHRCRSPLSFLLNSWRPGSWGALQMGVEHGAYCLGCCWALMALLFVAGVMNLLWIAILAVLVLVEKVAPAGHIVSRIAGVVFVIWGIWLLAGAFA
jgi:predicted metal-binding membrane protein